MAKATATPGVIDATIASIQLENPANPAEKITFSDLWREAPVAIVFLRRFGCQMCRVHAQDLEVARPAVEANGARLVCIGHEYFGEGSDKDRSWSAGGFFNGPIWVDTAKALYKHLYSRKTLLSGFGLFDMSKERLRQIKERNVPGNFSGDGFQLGGTLVVDTDGSILLDHRAKYYGDDATNDSIIEALATSKALPEERKAGLRAITGSLAYGAATAAAKTPATVCTKEACA